MVDRAFVDTNILLRTMLPQMTMHTEAEALIQQMWTDKFDLWISGQVIREFLVQATHPNTLTVPLTMSEAVYELRKFTQLFTVADETAAVRAKLLELLQTYPAKGKQVHDANLVATMLVNRVDTLLTMNYDDLKRFSDIITLIPLTPSRP